MATPVVKHPTSSQVVKIYEDTATGKYCVQIDNAVGTGTTLNSREFDDNHLGDLRDHLRAVLKDILVA
jgi:hypothetical protein